MTDPDQPGSGNPVDALPERPTSGITASAGVPVLVVAASEATSVDYVLPLTEIAPALVRLVARLHAGEPAVG